MAITTDDFNKIWASTSPLTPYQFSESQYKEGWNFIGGTPPSRQMWDFLQKQNDEKLKYLLDNFDDYLPLAGGTMTGAIKGNPFTLTADDGEGNEVSLVGKPDGTLTWNSQPLLPVGVVQAFAGSTIPTGWLLCDGSAVSRTDYAALFAVIGTTYGTGDGSTTFNLPNLTDKFIQGNSTSGTVKSAGLPNITGGFGLRSVDGGQSVTWEGNDGAVKVTPKTGDLSNCVAKGSSQNPLMDVTIDASRSSSVYGNSTTVQPPALTMRYIIKY